MCGRPVIVSDIGGLAERVTNGVNGMTFPVKDPVALGSLILKLTENSALWHKLNGSITTPNTDHEMLSRHVAEWRTILDRREAA
jgi:glycosyltransferase involved in cell wall biosynthesis